MSPDLICESQPDAGADRTCWNPTFPGPARSELYEPSDELAPERPCTNAACWRHGVPPTPYGAHGAATLRLRALRGNAHARAELARRYDAARAYDARRRAERAAAYDARPAAVARPALLAVA